MRLLHELERRRPAPRSPERRTEYLLANSFVENLNFAGVRMLRARGYSVKHLVSCRGHTHSEEDYDLLGRWLQESWAVPLPAARFTSYTVATPGPLPASEALAQMTAF